MSDISLCAPLNLYTFGPDKGVYIAMRKVDTQPLPRRGKPDRFVQAVEQPVAQYPFQVRDLMTYG